jgi:hypothetical protein
MMSRPVKLFGQTGGGWCAAWTVACYCKSASREANWPCAVDCQHGATQPGLNGLFRTAAQVSNVLPGCAGLAGAILPAMPTMSLDRRMNLLNEPVMNDQRIRAGCADSRM